MASIWLATAAFVAVRLSGRLGGLDIHVYWHAAQNMARGLSPYTVRRFVYPPFAAVLVAPLGHLSWPSAKVVGCTVAGIAIALTVVISARAVGARLLGWRIAAITAVVAVGHMFFASTALGNVSALIAVLLAAFYLATARDNDWAAGAVLGVSLAIKPMLLPVLLVPLLWARWRAVLATAIAAVACTGIGALVVPNSGWFLTRALPFLWRSHPASFDPLNSTVSSVAHLVGAPIGVTDVARVLVVLAAAFVVVVVRVRHRRLDAVAAVTVGSAALLAQFCAGGLTEDHFLLTLIPLFVTLAADETYLWPLLAWPAAAAVSGVMNAPASWFGVGVHAQYASNTVVRLFGQLGVLAALAVTAVILLRRRRATGADAGGAQNLRCDPGPAIVQS